MVWLWLFRERRRFRHVAEAVLCYSPFDQILPCFLYWCSQEVPLTEPLKEGVLVLCSLDPWNSLGSCTTPSGKVNSLLKLTASCSCMPLMRGLQLNKIWIFSIINFLSIPVPLHSLSLLLLLSSTHFFWWHLFSCTTNQGIVSLFSLRLAPLPPCPYRS